MTSSGGVVARLTVPRTPVFVRVLEAGEMAAQGVLPAEGMARLLKLCAEDLEMTVDVFASNVEAKNAE